VRARRALAAVTSVLAFLLVWLALTVPDQLSELTPAAFVRLPVEALLLVALLLVLPPRPRLLVGALVGTALGLLVVLKMLDVGFFEALNRPFDPVIDWRYAGSLVGLVQDSFGRGGGTVLLVVGAVLGVAMLVLMPLSVVRLARLASARRAASLRVVAGLSAVWLLLALLDLQVSQGAVASTSTSTYAYGQVSRIPTELRDQRRFATSAASDPLGSVPSDRLLTGLRGKDVLFVFVESYGRVAVHGSDFSPGVRRVLRSGTRRLHTAGFSSRSAFLTSPTFGAISWLAHSTFQSGLWVDSQQRYDVLVTSPRLTLADAFGRAGWRTVVDVPANTKAWPQGAFYDWDHVYDSRNVGYAGPRFGYPTMPDQYTLDAFHRLELGRSHRAPVMAEIDLISSHAPWSRTPRMIPQSRVGDGSVFTGMPEQSPSQTVVWRSPDRVRQAYGESIQYSLDALVTFLTTYGSDDTVLVLLGDHQPATIVSGKGADHDVPVTVVARDPAVLRRVSSWGWQPGMLPAQDAPVWRMDAFRDRFLRAFGR
jgi:hypothetical protein